MFELIEQARKSGRQEMCELIQTVQQQNPQQQDQFSMFDKWLDRAFKLSEKIAPIRQAEEESKGVFGQVVDLARDAVNSPYTGPAAGAIATGVAQHLAQRAATQRRATQGGSAQAVPQTVKMPGLAPQAVHTPEGAAMPDQQDQESEEFSLDTVLDGIVDDLQEGNPPADAVDDVVRLATEKPETRPLLSVIMNMSNEQILQEFHRVRGVDLSGLKGAAKFLNGLRKGIAARIDLSAPPPTDPSSNGHAEATA